MLSLKCGYPFLCELSVLFSKVKIELGTFLNLSIDSNLDFEKLFWGCILSSFP